VRLNTVVSRANYLSLVEMPAYLRERPVDGWLLIPMDAKPGVDNASEALTAEDVRTYNAHVAPVLAETVRVPGFDPWVFGRGEDDVAHAAEGAWARGFYRDHLCRVPWFHTLVDSRGDVYPCCMGHRSLPPLGNVRTASVAEIFNGPAYIALRQQMERARLAPCHRCDDFLAENRAFVQLEEGWR
jgi:radical SAM protein with 4Fe4S-binding SPASM domain